MAIRSATAMGLNLRSESNYVTATSKETRYRVWWSLYTLETILCNMTGRPFGAREEFCTTPLPIPFEEGEFADTKVTQIMADNKVRNSLVGQFASRRAAEPSATMNDQAVREGVGLVGLNTSLYFLFFVDLTLCRREAIETLYAPGDAQKPWQDVETIITDLNSKADKWLFKLPDAFRFADEQKPQAFERQRLSLALHFYSTRILICKPCLHHPDRRLSGDDSFCDTTSAVCVEAACRMLDLFPAGYDATWLNQNSPWWSILHYILQATSVLLMELSFRSRAKPQGQGGVLEKVRKAADWLRGMGTRSLASHRAWTVCSELLSRFAPKNVVEDGVDSSEVRVMAGLKAMPLIVPHFQEEPSTQPLG
jgi:hypothetical protein